MSNKTESATDEDDEAFQAWVRRAVSPLREMLKREYDERVKGRRVMRLWRSGGRISKPRYCATCIYGKADALYRIQIYATDDVWQVLGVPSTIPCNVARPRKTKVFVSYSRHDEELVKPLAGLLGAAANDAVFFDVTSLKPGDVWEDKIFVAVKEAPVFVVCWCCESPSLHSSQGKSAQLFPKEKRDWCQCSVLFHPIAIKPGRQAVDRPEGER